MIHLVLCGGNGRRLWPLSNQDWPKSFLRFANQPSMFQQTIKRNRLFSKKTLVIANERHAAQALSQSGEANPIKFLWESSARNTAAAIALACLGLQPDEIVLVTPCDHWIEHQEDYDKTIRRAIEIANQNHIAVIGVMPTRPYEEYGYIRAEGEQVISFCEKPKVDQIVDFLNERNWFWNSGIYCFKAGILLEELHRHSLPIWESSKRVNEKRIELASNQTYYPDMDCILEESIDRAVIEKSSRLKMVLLQTSWSDIGSFEDLARFYQQSTDVLSKESNTFQFQSNNNVVLADSIPIALIDVNDLIVVATKEGILISKRGSSHKVKHLVNSNNLSNI